MNNEIAAYEESIGDRIKQIRELVERMTPAQANWRPPFDEMNSIWALAAHALGNARAWIIGIAAGNEIGRDRPGEFASSGEHVATLLSQIDRIAGDVVQALNGIDTARLDVRLVPSQELWGEGPPREISVRDAIVQVIEHLSLHLGHMQVTRDLASGRAQASATTAGTASTSSQPGAAVPRQ
jgi:hypothetical protein